MDNRGAVAVQLKPDTRACLRRREFDGRIDQEVCTFGTMASGLYRRITSQDDRYRAAFINPNSKLLGPKFQLDEHGRSGAELPEMLPHLAEVGDHHRRR